MNAGHSRLLVVCLLAALAVGGGGALLAEPADAQSAARLVQQDTVDADEVRMSVALREDGSATWRIEFWSVLDDDESQAAFDSLRTDIQTDPANYTESFAGRIETTVAAASNATGREMAADNVTVTTERQSLAREYGVVTYAFEWEGFARVVGEELYAGDGIEGLFLDDGTRLLISWPAGYELDAVSPEPDDRRETAVLWRGTSTEFITGEPRVALTPAGLGGGTLAALFGGLALLTGGAGWLLRRRATESEPESEPESESESEPIREPTAETAAVAESADESAGSDPDQPEQSAPPDSAAAADEPDTVAADAEPGTQDTETEDQESETPNQESTEDEADASEIDTELLSNEEQVMQLLEAEGGRMKQQTIVQELGWTDAKTSKVVSGMREDGTIESFRIGRENVLTTPDDDPEEPGL